MEHQAVAQGKVLWERKNLRCYSQVFASLKVSLQGDDYGF